MKSPSVQPWSDSTLRSAQSLGDLGQRDISLSPWCTYRVGGPAAVFIEIQSIAQLELVAKVANRNKTSILVIGKGSNLLVSDRGFDGIVLHLGDEFAAISSTDLCLTAGGAAMLPIVARRSAKLGLTGFEWAVGVPGSVGGAVRMNAGGHGSEIAESLIEATIFDLCTGMVTTHPNEDLHFGYRKSCITSTDVVLKARFQLNQGDTTTSEQEISEVVRWRREHQPGGQNAGSVFANPEGDSAGRLIDAVGLRGHRLNSAVVSDKHANFIQCDSDGSADDVFALIRVIQHRVQDNTGIVLRPENRLIGFPEPSTLTQDLTLPSGSAQPDSADKQADTTKPL